MNYTEHHENCAKIIQRNFRRHLNLTKNKSDTSARTITKTKESKARSRVLAKINEFYNKQRTEESIDLLKLCDEIDATIRNVKKIKCLSDCDTFLTSKQVDDSNLDEIKKRHEIYIKKTDNLKWYKRLDEYESSL